MNKTLKNAQKFGIEALIQLSRCPRDAFIREVSLGVCIPTFKRPERVISLINSILRSEELKKYSLKVYLVDQGNVHTADDFIQDARLNIYHQANLGGSGGFARAMQEAMSDGCTHVLLMDDDVTVEAVCIKRVIHFYSALPDGVEIALSGAMYSEEDPDHIYEAGARLPPVSTNKFDVVRRLAGVFIVDKDDDPKLSEDWSIDYGAWYFFACSTDAIRRVGLPLPLFIRGDDQEYGLRLKSANVPTVCLPGLRVLHPSHADKICKWYLYFHWRNVFIINKLHRKINPIGMRIQIYKKIVHRWLGGQSDICRFIMEGWKDSIGWSVDNSLAPDLALEKARSIERKGCAGLYRLDELSMPLKSIGDQHWPWWKELVMLLLLNGRFCPKRKLDYLPVLTYKEYHWMKVRFLRKYGIISRTEGKVKIYEIK